MALADYAKDAIEKMAMGERFIEFKLNVSHGSSKGDNFLGEIYRVEITGVRDNKKESTSVILKMAPGGAETRDRIPIDAFYRNEHTAYSRALPALDSLQDAIPTADRFRHAKLLAGSLDSRKELLLLEDLAVDGFRMHDRFQSLDGAHLALIVRQLARFHATSLVMRAKDPAGFQSMVAAGIHVSAYKPTLVDYWNNARPMLEELVADEPYGAKMNRFFDGLLDELITVHHNRDSSAPYSVMLHGDCWSNNFLFRYAEDNVVDVRLVDWQLFGNGSPVMDLAYAIFSSTDRDTRKKHYDEMLSLYYATLTKNVTLMGVDIDQYYPHAIYRNQLPKYMRYGLIMSFFVLPLLQGNVGEVPDLADLVKQHSHREEYRMKLSAGAARRIKDVIEDCIAYELI